ncbi:MAG: hypothetical protein OXC60_02500 [Litoreibacter sp.]|nr:hypothetical protein [Litoreibacter sp.]
MPCLLLVGCAAPEPRLDPIPFALDASGIQLLDRPQRVDFGRTDHSALSATEKLTGGSVRRQGVCANGGSYALFEGGVALHFVDGNFVGWARGETNGPIQQAGRACVKA